jgi:hypothetical protein
LLVARGITPADAADGIGAVNPKPLAAKWMKKPKIQEGIEKFVNLLPFHGLIEQGK